MCFEKNNYPVSKDIKNDQNGTHKQAQVNCEEIQGLIS